MHVADQDNVRIGVTANKTELFAIEGPMKIGNMLGGELGDLPSLGAIQWLLPEVIDASRAHGVNNRLAVG